MPSYPPSSLASSLAPDLVAMVAGEAPHPELGQPGESLPTVAGLAAAARMAAGILGEEVTLSLGDGRVVVAGTPGLAPGHVRLVAAGPGRGRVSVR